MPDLKSLLIEKLKVLNGIWENQATQPVIDAWLSNFSDHAAGSLQEQEIHALYMLSRFMYFGRDQMRELLRSLYRDLFRYGVIEEIRRANQDTTDEAFLSQAFREAERRTRFLGVGNPSESGTHLLYYFRQENRLPSDLFINTHQVFDRAGGVGAQLKRPDVRRYVFIDDFCGSGTQGVEYSRDIVEDMKRLDPSIHVSYYVLFATDHGMRYIKQNTVFDRIETVYELDETFRCFGDESRYFRNPPVGIDKDTARALALHYGSKLRASHPLGYKDGQLLIGFYHNTPDNTLPIIWYGEPSPAWIPMFRRYEKLSYGGSP
jgi:hypothetical protein